MTHPLLTPRYMVEADYPNSPYEVGQILTAPTTDVQNYPHIFRPMHWSEQRELGEMPRYIKDVYSGHMLVIEDWKTEIQNQYFERDIKYFTPATEAEYLEYLKSKTNESI